MSENNKTNLPSKSLEKRELQRRREFMMAKWFKSLGADKNLEMADLYLQYTKSNAKRKIKKIK